MRRERAATYITKTLRGGQTSNLKQEEDKMTRPAKNPRLLSTLPLNILIRKNETLFQC